MREKIPFLFTLAYANITKARLRTILTFLIIAFAMIVFIVLDGLVLGFSRLSMDNIIGFKTGHIKIRSADFNTSSPFSIMELIEDPASIESVLRKKSYVKGYTRRLVFSAEIDNGIDALSVVAFGIDPATDSDVFKLENYVSEGSLEPETCLLGGKLARDLHVGAGDLVFLTFRDTAGAFVSAELIVGGIVDTLNPAVNASSVFIHLDEAAAALSTDSVSEITILTSDQYQAEAYAGDIKKDLPPGYSMYLWRDMAADVLAIVDMDISLMYIFVVFIGIIGMVGIINTMLMSVYEKMREIGTLKALGMTSREIKSLFVIEGMMIGVVGGIAGIVIGVLANVYFVQNGVDITALVGERVDMEIGYRVMGVIKSAWHFSAIFRVFILCVAVSALASLYPASKATKMQPVDCLRVGQ